MQALENSSRGQAQQEGCICLAMLASMIAEPSKAQGQSRASHLHLVALCAGCASCACRAELAQRGQQRRRHLPNRRHLRRRAMFHAGQSMETGS